MPAVCTRRVRMLLHADECISQQHTRGATHLEGVNGCVHQRLRCSIDLLTDEVPHVPRQRGGAHAGKRANDLQPEACLRIHRGPTVPRSRTLPRTGEPSGFNPELPSSISSLGALLTAIPAPTWAKTGAAAAAGITPDSKTPCWEGGKGRHVTHSTVLYLCSLCCKLITTGRTWQRWAMENGGRR